MSRSELDALVTADLDQQLAGLRGSYPDLATPEAKFVRYISEDESKSILATCMEDHGFPSSPSSDGSAVYDGITGEQLRPFEIAQYQCAAMYPLDPKYRVPLNEKQLGYLYDYLVGDLTECLRKHDFQVTVAPPSRALFIANYYDEGGVWTPYDGVQPGGAAKWSALNEACPQTPTGLMPK